MIEALEAEFAEPSITPDDAALAFLSALLEDYADEWLNKAMFHYRWSYEEDRAGAARRTVDMLFEGVPAPEGVEEAVQARMLGRLHHAGSSPETAPVIEGSFARLLHLLQALLGDRPFLFGGRPCLADFGFAGQLRQLLSDPTPSALIKAQSPALVAWIERMEDPRADGPFAPFEVLRAPLADLLREEMAGAYLLWMSSNARAVAADALNVRVEIGGVEFAQKPQRYAAKALAALRRKCAEADASETLAALLAETGCDAVLMQAAPEAGTREDADDDSDENGVDGNRAEEGDDGED